MYKLLEALQNQSQAFVIVSKKSAVTFNMPLRVLEDFGVWP
jgi:hypothetical protein